MRVALIYDDERRPETTGTYCRRALGSLASVRHVRPGEADGLQAGDFDLFLRVDDGLDHPWPEHLRPSALWAIDTHVDFERLRRLAEGRDLVFAAQKNGAARLRQAGIDAEWLPLACDPEIHGRQELDTLYDVSFVGHLFPGPREELVRLLERRFSRVFVGRRYFEEMAEIYSRSLVVFNRSVKDDVNMRVFEGLCSGSLLMTNAVLGNGQENLFADGTHLATYADAEELVDKTTFYLARASARERIAAAGRAEVVARHTYAARMAAILDRAQNLDRRRTTGQAAAIASPAPAADPLYFDLLRPEILELVPPAARRVLDVGCGCGRLGLELKRRQGAYVAGIERSADAAAIARTRLDEVVVADVDGDEIDFPDGSYDAAVCGDVLEHLRDPASLLRRLRRWLRPGGRLIASVPNVRFHSIVESLLDGNWTYEAAGLLDQDHLRFFTRRGVEGLLQESGFAAERIGYVPGPGHDDWVAQGRPPALDLGRLRLEGIGADDASEFFAYQFLVTATPATESAPWLANHGSPADRDDPPDGSAREPALSRIRRELREEHDDPPRRNPMRFRQDFRRDFDEFDLGGPPFAFARFADGERAILLGEPIVGIDGWSFTGGRSDFVAELWAALRCSLPGYYLGISDGCCDREARDFYLREARVPLDRITFSNIFVNANYRRFQKLDLSKTVVVSSGRGDFRVPENLFEEPFDWDALVDQLLTADRPILVSAGPATGVIVRKYWARTSRPVSIVDVGSALDERTKGRATRPYQRPGTRHAELVCRW